MSSCVRVESGLLPGGLPHEGWYVGWEILMAWRGDANGTAGDCLGLTVLSSVALAVLPVIGGVEQNPGPVVGVGNTVRLLCTGCGRSLKSGVQCELCGRWHHYSRGSVTAQTAERESWNCDKCRTERVRMLQEELQNGPRVTDELKARDRELEAKLLMAGTGERDTVPTEQSVTKCFNFVLPCITV